MKRPLHAYTLNPSAGTLDLSGIPNFDIRNLFGVVHLPTGVLIYAPTPGATYASISGGVLHLKVPVFAFSASDPLLVIYDDGGKPAEDASLQALLTALAAPAQDGTDATGVTAPAGGNGIRGWLSGTFSVLSARLPALGQAPSAASVPVVLSSDGPFTTNFGAKTDAAATSDGGAFSLIALTKRSLGYLATLAGTVASGALQIAIRSNAPRVSNTASLAAQSATVTLAVDGMATGVAQITGTWAGSVSWAGSIDGQATYFPINVTPFGAGGGASISAATANGQWEFSAAGLTHVQATMTAWTSGSASVLLAASSGGKIARVKAPAGDPLPTIAGGSVGTDFSAGLTANGLAIPNVGAAFAASGPYSGYTLVKTLPALASRAYAEVDNLSTGQVVVIRDDATALSGAAPNNASIIVLNPAPAIGQPGGGGWTTTTFKGRIQIYAPAGTTPLVTAFQD